MEIVLSSKILLVNSLSKNLVPILVNRRFKFATVGSSKIEKMSERNW